MVSGADATLRIAWDLYKEGEYAAAFNRAVVASKQANHPRYGLHLACRCLLEDRRYKDVLVFLEKIHSGDIHAANVLLGALNAYMLDGRYDLLHTLCAELPETHLAGHLALYHSACAHIGQGDLQAGLEKALLFRKRCGVFWQVIPFVDDDALNVLFRQTASLGNAADIDARIAAPPAAVKAIHDVEWQTDPPAGVDESVVYFACADTGYLRNFSGHLLGSLNTVGRPVRVHLNVMRPDETIVDDLRTTGSTLPNITLDVSTSQTRNTEPSLFASGRFYLVPELLERYRVPIVTVDADSHVTPRILDLADMQKDFDVGFFQTKKITPASMFDCAVFVSCPGDGARAFYKTFLSYIDPLLDGQQRLTWLVDQATIFSLWVYYNETATARPGNPVRLVDLRGVSGIDDLYEMVPNAVPEEDKDAIRIANSVSALLNRKKSGGQTEGSKPGDS
ncbi:MAG: hypothetical protein RIM72_17765 [Alphaproteobacteria bacterium]